MPISKQINKSFFKVWTPQMAYILGFLTADGTLIKNKRGAHFIEIEITDQDLLIKIRNLLGSDHKISSRKRKDGWSASYRLQIGRKEIYYDLLSLGLTPNKSKTVAFPNVPQKYASHFVRGYFDGDGSVTETTYIRADRGKQYTVLHSGFIFGSKQFLQGLHDLLKKYAKIKGGGLSYSKGYRLFFSKNDSLVLYKFIYSDCGNLFLARKRQVFQHYFNMDR